MNKVKYRYRQLQLVWVVIAAVCLGACKEEFDHTIDTANPTVVSYNPVSGVEGIAIDSRLILTFDEIVKKGKGTITIAGESGGTQVIDVTSDDVTIGEDERIVTIVPSEFDADEVYTVTLERGIVMDLLDNEFMGLPEGTSWTFTTAGESGLPLTAMMPANGGTDASLFDLYLAFASAVSKGEGNIRVIGPDGSVLADLPVASQQVMINGGEVTVSLPTPLAFATDYRVTIEEGAFVDINGKTFQGFDEASPWAFTTTAGSADDVVVYLPMDDDLADASGNRFDATLGMKATAEIGFVEDPIRGKVVEFNPGSYAVLPKHDLLRPTATQNFSINLWVKLQGIGSDPVIFSNSDWDSGSNPGLVLCTDGGATYNGTPETGRGWIVKVAGSDANARTRIDWRAGQTNPPAPALSDNRWHMVTMVINQTEKQLQVYIDGTAYAQDGNPSSDDLSTLVGPLWDEVNDYPFTLWEGGTGDYNAGSDTRKVLTGLMDELHIYKKALTEAEVTALYND
ncbi:Ig-like domain-containing protein [Parapedobacter pyrenivorans]|nr:Ig-like domain-containing protein [Parapedobacter pyrenivorans]